MQLRESSKMTAGEIWHSLGLPHLGDPVAVARMDEHELLRLKGVGPALLARAKAAVALLQWDSPATLQPLASHAEAAVTYFREQGLHNHPHEELWILMLNVRNRVIAPPQAVFVGSMTKITVDVAKVIRLVLSNSQAAGFILAHNHPSGDTSPSAEDLVYTQQVNTGAEAVGLRFHDHLILGAHRSWTSIRRYGWPA